MIGRTRIALTPGTRLGPYDIVALIGVGGMGEVHKARDPRLDRNVAIEVLPAELASRADRSVRPTLRVFAQQVVRRKPSTGFLLMTRLARCEKRPRLSEQPTRQTGLSLMISLVECDTGE